MNGILIGSMSTIGVALIVVLCVLWVCLLSKNDKLSGKYFKVDKQHAEESSKCRPPSLSIFVSVHSTDRPSSAGEDR